MNFPVFFVGMSLNQHAMGVVVGLSTSKFLPVYDGLTRKLNVTYGPSTEESLLDCY